MVITMLSTAATVKREIPRFIAGDWLSSCDIHHVLSPRLVRIVNDRAVPQNPALIRVACGIPFPENNEQLLSGY